MSITQQAPVNEMNDDKLLPRLDDARICPVQALDHWRALSQHTTGPVFRGVTRYDTVLGTAITHPTANRMIKQLAARAGIPHPERYSGHSLRATFITVLRQHGIPDNQIVLQTKQRTPTQDIYSYPELTMRDNPASKFGKILQAV